MKKYTALLLCLLLTVSLFGCGGYKEEPTVPVTGTPDGEPKTEGFMTDPGFSFDLSLLDNKTYVLVGGEYRNLAYPDDLPENANDPDSSTVSEVTFHKDMTAHFKFEDGKTPTIDDDYNYFFHEDNILIGFFEDTVQPSIEFESKVEEDIQFAFRSDGTLWVVFCPDHPLYEYYFGLYQLAE